jgi:hypothetical protein
VPERNPVSTLWHRLQPVELLNQAGLESSQTEVSALPNGKMKEEGETALAIRRIFRLAGRALATAGVLVFLVYVGDSLSIRLHFPRRDPFGTVQIQPYYAVRLKNHKIDYTMADPETETCVHSLFPQSGYTPCWYLSRHTQRRIDIDSLLPVPEMVSARLQPLADPGP